jgi:hypothetical protein
MPNRITARKNGKARMPCHLNKHRFLPWPFAGQSKNFTLHELG